MTTTTPMSTATVAATANTKPTTNNNNNNDDDDNHWRQVPTDSSAYGNWTKIAPKEYCVADPGLAWEERNYISCDIRWPQGRRVLTQLEL